MREAQYHCVLATMVEQYVNDKQGLAQDLRHVGEFTDLAKQGLLYGLRPNPQRNPMAAIRLRRPPWGNAPIDAATERYRFPA